MEEKFPERETDLSSLEVDAIHRVLRCKKVRHRCLGPALAVSGRKKVKADCVGEEKARTACEEVEVNGRRICG